MNWADASDSKHHAAKQKNIREQDELSSNSAGQSWTCLDRQNPGEGIAGEDFVVYCTQDRDIG